MSSYKNIELRFFLLGEEFCGKKTIARRFRKLNSTDTLEDQKIDLTVNEELIKILKKREVNKFKSIDEIRDTEQKRLKNLDASSFTKLLRLGNISLESKFFIPSQPTPISPYDAKEIVDELDELEKAYKLKFDLMKNEIKYYLNQPNFNYFKSKVTKTLNIFLFIYDLTRPETLNKAIIYFEELKKTFNFETYKVIFIGNKMDIKGTIPTDKAGDKKDQEKKEDPNNIIISGSSIHKFSGSNSHIKKRSSVEADEEQLELHKAASFLINNADKIKHYEISSKNFFSFERFFERLFIENIQFLDKENFDEVFLERLSKDIYLKGTFSKSKRSGNLFESSTTINPGPSDYNTDIYYTELNSEVFKNKDKNIFINKSGPVFKTSKKEVTTSINKKESEEEWKEEKIAKTKREKLLEELSSNKQGWSLGIKEGEYDFFSIRNNNKKERASTFSKLLSLDNITKLDRIKRVMHVGSPITRHYKSPPKDKFLINKKIIDAETEKYNEKIIDNLEERERKIKELKSVNQLQHQQAITELISKRQVMKEKVEENKTKLIKEDEDEKYNILSSHNLPIIKNNVSKGCTIVGKPKDIISKSNPNHNFYTIKSEFDNIIEESKEANFPKAERFSLNLSKEYDKMKKKYVYIHESESNDIRNRKFEELEWKSAERLKMKEECLQKEHEAREEKRRKLEMMKMGYDEEMKERNMKNNISPGVWSYEPDYYKWGSTAPLYSMSGKLGGGMFDKKKPDESNRIMDFDQSIKFLANSIDTNKLPVVNFNAVQYSPPKYTFPKAENRFISKTNNQVNQSSNINPYNEYLIDRQKAFK